MAVFVTDSFTGTNNDTLHSTHVGETGADWDRNSVVSASGDFEISDANRARMSVAGALYASGVPAGADYYVEAPVHRKSNVGAVGVVGRMDTAANTMYYARYNATDQEWELLEVVVGTLTPIGTDYAQTLSDGSTYTLRLEMIGSAIKVYVDAVERIAATNSAITAAGSAGIRGASTAPTNSTGYHLDSFTAVDIVAASGPPSGSLSLLGVGR